MTVATVCLLLTSCGSDPQPRQTPPQSPVTASDWFVDVTAAANLTFTHTNGLSGEFLFPEVFPPGVALLDFDNDNDLDVFVVQGHPLTGVAAADRQGARLFRNELTPGGSLRFTDVTASSGIDARGYGMGVAAGDYNNDGCVDLYVTNFGANQLYRNNCNGTFADATRESATADPGWSVPAAFVDVDRDGWLDLFVGHYVNYAIASNIACSAVSGQRDYCLPQVYQPQPSRLFRNLGNGRFADVTASAGLSVDIGPALGVSTADFNGDGWMDIYVANDGMPNNLWINERGSRFRNLALLGGAAVSAEGAAKASMGVDAGDFDNDGDEDLFVTELTGQGADLYVNDGSGVFVDEAARAGLRLATVSVTGFGTAWLDYDNDGLLDLAAVNGAVTHTAEALARDERFALHQRRQLFRNTGDRRFEDVSDRAGAVFRAAEVGRGAAVGDVDNDGDADLLVANANGPLRLLRNETNSGNHWIGLRLVTGTRDALGARVAITRSDGVTLWRRARTDGSYASANDPRILAGLGRANGAVKVRVYWPDGTVEERADVTVDRYQTLVQGTKTGQSPRR